MFEPQLYKAVGREAFLDMLTGQRKDELLDVIRIVEKSNRKWTKDECVQWFKDCDNLEQLLVDYDQVRIKRSQEQFKNFKFNRNPGTNTRRENLSLNLHNILECLTDDEYEQVVNLARELQGKRTPQFY